MMKKWLRCTGIGILCSFSVMGALLAVLPLFTRFSSLFLTFPAFRIYVATESASMIFLRMALLFTCYGIAGASIYCICKAEQIPLLRQCAASWFVSYIALFVTVWMCDKFEYSWVLTLGSVLGFIAVWLLRIWRWKSRINEIGLALPQAEPHGKRRIWNTAVSQFTATALLWLIAAGYGAVLLLLLCV